MDEGRVLKEGGRVFVEEERILLEGRRVFMWMEGGF